MLKLTQIYKPKHFFFDQGKTPEAEFVTYIAKTDFATESASELKLREIKWKEITSKREIKR